jgi:glycosyltransferase involved in cell wall biosynthesis
MTPRSLQAAPRVSVVIPTHNRASVLPRAIASVVAQTFSDWECIIVDDASSDDTESVVAGYGDPRIKYLRLAVNQGQCAARNHGIRAASGEYVAFLDSDDEWLSGKLQAQLDVFAADTTGKLGIVLCGLIKIAERDGSELTRRMPGLAAEAREQLLHLQENPPTYTLMIKRTCFDHEWWDERLPHRTDWDLCVRLARQYRFGIAPQYLVRAYQHDGERTSRPQRPWSGWEYCIAKYLPDLQSRPKALAKHHYFTFRSYRSAGKLAGARRHLLLALRNDPFHPGQWITLGSLLLAPSLGDAIVRHYERAKALVGVTAN